MALVIKPYSPQPITDRLGRVIAVVAPAPNDPSYLESVRLACEKMKQEIAQANFEPKDLMDPKRGNGYYALNIGLSYGMGHTKLTNREIPRRFKKTADALLGDKHIQRLASYQDCESNSPINDNKMMKEKKKKSHICTLASKSLSILQHQSQ